MKTLNELKNIELFELIEELSYKLSPEGLEEALKYYPKALDNREEVIIYASKLKELHEQESIKGYCFNWRKKQ
jgi:hypothetical protein